MKKNKLRRMLSLALAVAMMVSLLVIAPTVSSAKTGSATDIGWPTFANLDPNVLNPGVPLDPTTNIRQAIYNQDAATGNGTSFYLDRVLNRAGNTAIAGDSGNDGNTVLTRGRSIYAAQSSVPTGLGWSNNIYWLEGSNTFNPLNVITFKNGTTTVTFTEQAASRNNDPSYWSSTYTTTAAGFTSVVINARKFISQNNVAVVLLDIVNNGTAAVSNINFTVTAASCTTAGTLPNGQPELTGVKTVKENLTTLYPRTTADLNGQPCTLAGTTLTTPTISIAAGSKAQLKVVTGVTTKELPETTTDYIGYATATADNAFTTQVQQFNKSYTSNIPYIDVPNKNIQKAIEYRWWLEQYNTIDANIPGYDFEYPDTMEGVLGYNNNVVLSECMRLEDTKWMRSAYLPYGSLLDVGNSSMSSAFLDNPGKIANWNNHYGQYIAQAGLSAYEVHGGPSSIAEEFANFFADDATGQLAHYGQHLAVPGRPNDAADNYGNAFLIGYQDGYMTGNDADTLYMQYANSGSFKLTPESAYVYAAANSAAQMYTAAGDTANASKMTALAGNIQQDALTYMWDDKNKTFEAYAVKPGAGFVVDDPANPNLIPLKVNNLYNFFSTGLVPTDTASLAKYGQAFNYMQYADEYPIFPCFTANQIDKTKVTGASNNFSNINFTLQERAYEAAIRTYDPNHQYVTPEMLSMLTAWQAYEVYPVNASGQADTRVPNNNEYYYNYNAATKQYTRSGIYHDTLGNYNSIFIEDMAGLQPRLDNTIELDPINFSSVNSTLPNAADFKYDHFMVNNLNYHGSNMSIVWDDPSNTTAHYNAPMGYSMYINGQLIFTVDHLAKILYDTTTGQLTVDGNVVSASDVLYLKSDSTSLLPADQVSINNDSNPLTATNFAKSGIDLANNLTNTNNLAQIPGTVATASYTATARAASWFEKQRADGTDPSSKAVNELPPSPAATIDGSTIGEPFWGTNASPNPTDWLQITFPSAQTFNNVKLFFYNDRDGFGAGTAGQGYAEPLRYTIQYLKDGVWTTVSDNNKTPLVPAANYNNALFDTVTSTAVRINVQKNANHPVAIAEAQVFNSPLVAIPVTNQPPVITAAAGTSGNLSMGLNGTYVDDGLPDDSNPSFAWTVTSAPAGAFYQITNANTLSASLIGDKAGSYTVKFTASDGQYPVSQTLTVTLAKAASADVAPSATDSAKSTASWENVTGPNNVSFNPASSNPGTGKAWGNWSSGAPTWYQYTWATPVYINSSDIYWYSDGGGTQVPNAWTIQYSNDGTTWTNVAIDPTTPYSGAKSTNKYNNVKFAPITTKYLRVNITTITGNAAGTGICRWKVYGPVIDHTTDANIMTPVGTVPTLPANDMVAFDNGVMMSFPVTWSPIDPASVNDENTFTVSGTVLGTLVKANIYVRQDAAIAQITDVWPISISTLVGTQPVYPAYADVSYNNGGRTNTVVPVTWNAVDQAAVNVNMAGSYTVNGTIQKGSDTANVTLTLTVKYDSSVPLAIMSISPITVSTPVGIAPTLPATVAALYNDGNTRQVAITWPTVDPANYAVQGNVFPVQGSAAGTAVPAVANVTVTAPVVSSITNTPVSTPAGIAPVLPPQVTEVWSDGSTTQANVAWDSIAPASYAGQGSFTVQGTVDGISIKAIANITVVAPILSSIADTTAATAAGFAPTLPPQVTEVMSDSSTVLANVTWDSIDPMSYAQAGIITVKGTVDGTALKAKANVTVTNTAVATLAGSALISNGAAFSLTYGLVGVQNISAQDVTISYDKNLYDFVGADPIANSLSIQQTVNNADNGTVRLIMASAGAENAISGSADVVKLNFKSKASGVGNIAITSAELSTGNGDVSFAAVSSTSVDAVDKTGLADAIAAAQQKHDNAVEGIDPGQYPGSAIQALKAAIDIAAGVNGDPMATSAAVAQAVSDLSAAVTVFNSTIVIEVDKTVLRSAISDAQAKHDTAPIGTDIGYYPKAAADAFQAAIDAATAVSNRISATTAEVAQAVADLNTASATFDSSVLTSADKTALIAAINTAQSIYDNAVEGISIGQYPYGLKDKLNTAIANATAVKNGNPTVAQITQAVTDLNAAVGTFQSLVITSGTGDIDGIPGVGVGDLGKVAGHFGMKAGDPNWNQYKNADINGDGEIGIFELAFIALKMIGK